MPEPEYLLTNARAETVVRFDALEEAFDALTTEHLRRVGVGPGWRCLELGAGGGSIAVWMATQVGSTGHVVATDLDVSRFQDHALDQLDVRRHDLVADALPEGPWDLIHERLVLQHVPARLEVLDRLVAALAPGGWIVLEDFDTGEVRTTDRGGPDHELIARVAVAFNRLLAARGGVSDFAANARRELMDRGLVDIGSSGHVSIAAGGTGFARAVAANTRQVRDQLEAAGCTPAELDRVLRVLDEPTTLVGSPVLISTWGRRPS
ncbi:MAG TPA: methyltransferase domain-containing protein [Ilumatobacteraceae bacterium]|nr:methyltransferase domain-containing protein [Ilumatobacteraceae bacterium]